MKGARPALPVPADCQLGSPGLQTQGTFQKPPWTEKQSSHRQGTQGADRASDVQLLRARTRSDPGGGPPVLFPAALAALLLCLPHSPCLWRELWGPGPGFVKDSGLSHLRSGVTASDGTREAKDRAKIRTGPGSAPGTSTQVTPQGFRAPQKLCKLTRQLPSTFTFTLLLLPSPTH